ncbi:MAG: hypothetical protein MI919_03460 [Holophagales bacterium]|nr:hypothetical protein [Holophagales bacterium]
MTKTTLYRDEEMLSSLQALTRAEGRKQYGEIYFDFGATGDPARKEPL